jgi:hypothetical protein
MFQDNARDRSGDRDQHQNRERFTDDPSDQPERQEDRADIAADSGRSKRYRRAGTHLSLDLLGCIGSRPGDLAFFAEAR